jgi:selenocysteine lyase/cysteine desulfurase
MVLREQARSEIKRSLNCGPNDQCIFCGSGATAAINKLIDIFNLRLPSELAERYLSDASIREGERPIVFIGPHEHHSNDLPWRESIADLVTIPLADSGQVDMAVPEQRLEQYSDRSLLIGSFSEASNATGIKSDITAITVLLKHYGVLMFWDYAEAAP